jgi:hypothetical protein
MTVSFGDNVRILATPATDAAGIAGLCGCVYGETVPSASGVDVLGELSEDYAVNVFVEELKKNFWLDPPAVEFIDHGAGTEIAIEGVPVTLVRQSDGSWIESDPSNKPWWRFW